MEARAAGLDIIIKEAMANGRLTSRNADPSCRDTLDKLAAVADKHHTTLDAIALACVLGQPFRPMVRAQKP